MHPYDWIILLCICLGAWSGYRTGAIAQIVRFCGMIVSYWIAFRYHQFAVPLIEKVIQSTSFGKAQAPFLTSMVSQGISFMVTFLFASFLFSVIGMFVQGIFLLPVLSLINRVLGLFVGAGLAVVIITVVIEVAAYAHIPNIDHIVNQSTLAQWLDQTFRGMFHTISPNNSDPFHIT